MKNFISIFATIFAVLISLPSFAQSDDRYKNHITGGYEMQSVKELQQQLNDSTVADSTNTETKEPAYRLHGENNIIRFNGGDTIYSVRVLKRPGELSKLCKELGISPDYGSRMNTIIIPLCTQGVVLFDKTTDPYFLEEDIPELKTYYGTDWDCYFYRGTDEQNAKLVRNIDANRNLFQNGKLTPGAYLHWKIVD